MSKITCNVIRDMLPLYVENVLSEDSVNLVDEHVKECPECKAELEQMTQPVVLPDFSKVQEHDCQQIKGIRSKIKKRGIITALISVLATLAVLLLGWIVTQPRSINDVLEKLDDPFVVGEVLTQLEIDDRTTVVFYTNKNNPEELQNSVIRRIGFFYKPIDNNGTLVLEKPHQLETGDLRSRMHISWYQKGSDKYVAMVVVYDKEVSSVVYGTQPLEKLDVDGLEVYLGFGESKDSEYHLLDADGKEMDHYAP